MLQQPLDNITLPVRRRHIQQRFRRELEPPLRHKEAHVRLQKLVDIATMLDQEFEDIEAAFLRRFSNRAGLGYMCAV